LERVPPLLRRDAKTAEHEIVLDAHRSEQLALFRDQAKAALDPLFDLQASDVGAGETHRAA
jgi:hypothetical protein